MIEKEFWNGRKVYLTGHTGFKGSWLAIWLTSLGAIVKGYSLSPPTNPSLFKEAKIKDRIQSEINDIRNFSALYSSIQEFSPEIVFNMAAQPLVRDSYEKPVETFETNVMGTVNLLETALNCKSVKAVINVTTDKCYENNGWVWGYRETDPMGGSDPYSSSKGCAELVSAAYQASFYRQKRLGLATVRAGNVIGGGDWSRDRLIPDIINAFENNKPVIIRNPNSVRPWQHVLEPLSGYLLLAEKLFVQPENFSGAWNFGPHNSDAREVKWIVEKLIESWPGSEWDLDPSDSPHEANTLRLDISKVTALLDWHPTWTLENTLGKIVRWHRNWLMKKDMYKCCVDEIMEFTN